MTDIEITDEMIEAACLAFAGRASEDEPYYDNIVCAIEAVAPLIASRAAARERERCAKECDVAMHECEEEKAKHKHGSFLRAENHAAADTARRLAAAIRAEVADEPVQKLHEFEVAEGRE